MLVAAILVTVVWGFGPGVAWAFVSGLTANLLTRDPLGSIPLSLLVVVAAAAGGERLVGRLQWAYPVLAIAIGSVVVDAVSLGIMRMVDLPLSGEAPLQRIIAAAALNALLGAIAIVPIRMLSARTAAAEKPAW